VRIKTLGCFTPLARSNFIGVFFASVGGIFNSFPTVGTFTGV